MTKPKKPAAKLPKPWREWRIVDSSGRVIHAMFMTRDHAVRWLGLGTDCQIVRVEIRPIPPKKAKVK